MHRPALGGPQHHQRACRVGSVACERADGSDAVFFERGDGTVRPLNETARANAGRFGAEPSIDPIWRENPQNPGQRSGCVGRRLGCRRRWGDPVFVREQCPVARSGPGDIPGDRRAWCISRPVRRDASFRVGTSGCLARRRDRLPLLRVHSRDAGGRCGGGRGGTRRGRPGRARRRSRGNSGAGGGRLSAAARRAGAGGAGRGRRHPRRAGNGAPNRLRRRHRHHAPRPGRRRAGRRPPDAHRLPRAGAGAGRARRAVPIPRLRGPALRCAPRPALGRGRGDGAREPRAPMPAAPSGGARGGLPRAGGRRRGNDVLRPDGRPLPEAPAAPAWDRPPLAPVDRRLAAAGIGIDADTAPRWRGERLDLGWALGVLWRPRAGADPTAGVPAGTSGP